MRVNLTKSFEIRNMGYEYEFKVMKYTNENLYYVEIFKEGVSVRELYANKYTIKDFREELESYGLSIVEVS